MMMLSEKKGFLEKGIVLFDGDCSFCNRTVAKIISRDRSDYFRFATLNSEIGKKLRAKFNLETVDSIILVEDGRAYIKSTAVLRILRRLGHLWKTVYVFNLIPGIVRDFAYDLFAASRYNFWAKQSDLCLLPTPNLRKKFLDLS